jgi:glutamate racemase
MDRDLPIGIFDSGLGGLTIVKAVQELLPGEAIIYYGDTAHLPYGDKSAELVRGYSAGIAGFLLEKNVKAIVIACNTASAVARDAVVNAAGGIPVFDVVNPAVDYALTHTHNQRVGVIGTKTTIRSGIYKRLLEERKPYIHTIEKATPLLVPMIEEGWLHNAVSQDVIDAYMSDTGFADIDTLILGCTHYPLIREQIAAYFEDNYDHRIQVVDSSLAVAGVVKRRLEETEMTASGRKPEHLFFLSDYNPHFQETARLFLGREAFFRTPE